MKAEVVAGQTDCPICLETFGESRPYAMQVCELHKVCVECTAKWRVACAGAESCPVCRGGDELETRGSW